MGCWVGSRERCRKERKGDFVRGIVRLSEKKNGESRLNCYRCLILEDGQCGCLDLIMDDDDDGACLPFWVMQVP